MKNSGKPMYQWPGISAEYVTHIFFFLLALPLVFTVLLGLNMIAPPWIITALVIVMFYFLAVHKWERRFADYDSITFAKKLFFISLAARLAAVVILVSLAELTWDRSFYVGAVDATRYYRVSTEVSELLRNFEFARVIPHLLMEYEFHWDNIGVPLFLGTIFSFTTNSVVWAKIIIAIMGSLSVVYIYKTADLYFESNISKLAGLLAALLPLSLFYDAVILKEPFVVFFASMVVYYASVIQKQGKLNIKNILLIVLPLAAIFLVRTAAGAVLVMALAGFFMLNRVKGTPIVSWATGMVITGLFIYLIGTFSDTWYFIERIEGGAEVGEARIAAVEGRTAWQNLGIGPLFLIISHFAPFPAVVELNPVWGHDATYYWIAGIIIWNLLSIYAILGIWEMIKRQPMETMMIWGFTVGLTLVLGITAMFTQVRQSWVVMPLMMIPAAVGLVRYKQKYIMLASLGSAFALVILWNLFRAMGRGVL